MLAAHGLAARVRFPAFEGCGRSGDRSTRGPGPRHAGRGAAGNRARRDGRRRHRRRGRRPRDRVEPDRPARADRGRVVDARLVRRRAACRRPCGAPRNGLHRPGRPHRAAAGPDDRLPRVVPGPRRPQDVQPARAGSLPLRARPEPPSRSGGPRQGRRPAGRVAKRPPRLVRRHRGAGLRHRRRRAAVCACTRRCGGSSRTSSSTRGDTIYADNPLVAEMPLDDGTVWRNIVTPAKSKVAETLDEFRGNYRYNLLDEQRAPLQRRGAAARAVGRPRGAQQLVPGHRSSRTTRYTEKSVALLAARARRAFLEYTPDPLPGRRPERVYRTIRYGPLVDVFVLDMRSYRGPNTRNRQPVLGARVDDSRRGAARLAQAAVSPRRRRRGRSIASDMPLGLVVRGRRRTASRRSANGDPGAPLGPRARARRAAARSCSDEKVRNVVWITADVHYAAAHHYDPARAAFRRLRPVLGVRRRAAPRRHLRPHALGRDVRPVA